jgi:D-amino-acid oxidase
MRMDTTAAPPMARTATPQLVDRRRLLALGGVGAASLALPGCATTRTASLTSTGCLPPVLVGADRIIREVVGLRPYRASGFVVREERVGPTRLVHNYGHGGAGITLSWGSSRLAVDLGARGHSGPVAVIGAGIMGLTTARLAQEAGFPVTIYAAALPPETTSDLAGGQWHPFGHYREDAVTPEWRRQYLAAADYSWRRFQTMVGDDYGVRWLPTYVETGAPEQPLLATFPPASRMLTAGEHPFVGRTIARYETLYVETGRFLRQMQRDIRIAGGQIEARRFSSRAEIGALEEKLVFNCTGLGARDLFGDGDLRPARGQLAVLLPQPEVRYALSGRSGYMFPRPDGIILGGTFELDEWSTTPDPATTQRILANHAKVFGGLRCSP